MKEADTDSIRSENPNNENTPLQEGFKEKLLTRFFPTTERKSLLIYTKWIGIDSAMYSSLGAAIAICVPLLTTFYTEAGQNASSQLLDLAQKGAIITAIGMGLFGVFSGYCGGRAEVSADQKGIPFYLD